MNLNWMYLNWMQVGGSCVRFSQVGTLRHLRCHLLCEVLSNFSQCLLVFLLASIALSSYPIIAFITLLLVSFTKYSYLRTETHIFIFVSLVLIISLFLACSYLSVILPTPITMSQGRQYSTCAGSFPNHAPKGLGYTCWSTKLKGDRLLCPCFIRRGFPQALLLLYKGNLCRLL